MGNQPYDVMILSGGFDPLHVGHVRMIQAARAQAALVVVGLNSDAWVEQKKGRVPLRGARSGPGRHECRALR